MRARRVISTIDAHAGGEPLRIVTAGFPVPRGETVLDRRRWFEAHHDDLRRLLLFEPRGHADMYGAILTPPTSPGADHGVIFLTNEGYSTMCGHGIIALTTALLETGALPMAEPETTVTYDAPAGPIVARASVAGERVTGVTFANVPSYVIATDVPVRLASGEVRATVAWGGAAYALVEAADLGIAFEPGNAAELVRLGMEVKRAVSAAVAIDHPEDGRLSGLYGTIISAPPTGPGADGRNVTVYADGAIDRSPCGTGTSAKLAALHVTGRLATGQDYVHESIIGTAFTGRVTAETTVAGRAAVETEIAGRGFVTGFHQFVLDPDDPLAAGFLLR
ncbi:MAG: proline racemase family protein [Thermomicrobiales bacterium]